MSSSNEEQKQAMALDRGDHRDKRSALERELGYVFVDQELLVQALTHRSYANERDIGVDNQRLEYLGDAVLDLVISTELFSRYPELPEGKLSYLRSQLVCEKSLAAQARKISLGECILLGKGEAQSGGQEKDSVLADAYEAVLAAIYMDSGFQRTNATVVAQFDSLLSSVVSGAKISDYKTRLQEIIQADKDERPHYAIVDVGGPPHARVYTAIVSAGEEPLGEGTGCSKKAAQQDAARVALEALGGEHA